MEISEIYDDNSGEKTIKFKFKNKDFIDGFALEEINNYFQKKHGISYPNKIQGIDFDERMICDSCQKQIFVGERYYIQDSAIGEYEMDGECAPVETKHDAKKDKLLCMHCHKTKQIDSDSNRVDDYSRE